MKKLNKSNLQNQKRLVNAFETISKALASNNKSDFAINKHSEGGQLLASTAQFIPGIGQVISPLIAAGDAMRDQMQIEHQQQNAYKAALQNDIQVNKSVYGYAKGGHINSGFKQYNAGSHSSGADQRVDQHGNPNASGTSAIQNKENSFKTDKGTFVMSDTLTNPLTGNTFNIDAAMVNKKYKKADQLTEEKNALNFEMNKLSKVNDMVKNVTETIQKATGGMIKQYPDGGPLDSPTAPKTNSIFDLGLTVDNNTDPITDEISVPPSDNFMFAPQDVSANVYGRPEPLTPLSQRQPTLSGIQSVEYPNTVPTANPRDVLNNIGNRITSRDNRESGINSTSFGDMNTVAVALKAAALGRSAYDATRSFERESLISPDYTKADAQMYKRNYDYSQARQAASGAANMMSSVNRSSAGNFSQYQNRQAQNFGNLADNMSNIYQQEENQNIGLNLQRSGYEGNKAIDFANRQYQNRMDNQMNKANRDFATDKFFSDLSQVGTSFNEYQYHKDMVTNQREVANAKINEGLALIGSNYSNFGFTEDFMNNLKNGTAGLDDKIKFISTVEKIKVSQQPTKTN